MSSPKEKASVVNVSSGDGATFTPGPWRLDEAWNVRCPCRGFEDEREADGKVCEVKYRPNGYLIAAAPDLFKVVQAYVRYMDDPDAGTLDIEETLLRDMRAAIRSATRTA